MLLVVIITGLFGKFVVIAPGNVTMLSNAVCVPSPPPDTVAKISSGTAGGIGSVRGGGGCGKKLSIRTDNTMAGVLAPAANTPERVQVTMACETVHAQPLGVPGATFPGAEE